MGRPWEAYRVRLGETKEKNEGDAIVGDKGGRGEAEAVGGDK